MDINNFLLILNEISILKTLKRSLTKKYNIKDYINVKTIINQQITRDILVKTIKINKLPFIQYLIIKKKLINCNAKIIPKKTGLKIEMIELDNYNKTNLQEY